jgi:hypothetical protein
MPLPLPLFSNSLGEEAWMGGEVCVSILTPSPSIYMPGSPCENTPSTTLGSNGETTHGR